VTRNTNFNILRIFFSDAINAIVAIVYKMTQTNPLQYRPNACPLCLTCLVCTEVYGKNCICPPKELKWQRKSNEYKIDFRHKPLDTVTARKQKIKLDNVFVNWFHSNISRIATCYTDIHIRK